MVGQAQFEPAFDSEDRKGRCVRRLAGINSGQRIEAGSGLCNRQSEYGFPVHRKAKGERFHTENDPFCGFSFASSFRA